MNPVHLWPFVSLIWIFLEFWIFEETPKTGFRMWDGTCSYFEEANTQPICNLSLTAASYIAGKGLSDILPPPLFVCPKDTGTDSKSSVKTNAQTQVTNEVQETHLEFQHARQCTEKLQTVKVTPSISRKDKMTSLLYWSNKIFHLPSHQEIFHCWMEIPFSIRLLWEHLKMQ